MAYDPYSQMPNDPSQSGMKEIAGQALNPINWYMWRYKYDPRAWSLRRGLQMPFGGRAFDAVTGLGFKDTFVGGNSFFSHHYGFSRASGRGRFSSAFSATKKSLKGEWYLGERFFTETGKQLSSNKALRKGLAKSVTDKLVTSNLSSRDQARVGKVAARHIEDMIVKIDDVTKINQEMIRSKMLGLKNTHFVRSLGMDSDEWVKLMNKKGGLPSNAAVAKIIKAGGGDKIASNLANAGWKRSLRFAGRGALAIGKGAATAASLYGIYEITKMVGEPIGRYLVENANRVANEYANRYGTEMGGQIAMSYMSTGAATERQRAVQAISKSYMNGRSAIGNEAQYLHS